jgi:hypothetical protein
VKRPGVSGGWTVCLASASQQGGQGEPQVRGRAGAMVAVGPMVLATSKGFNRAPGPRRAGPEFGYALLVAYSVFLALAAVAARSPG